jgi:biopolymer transport protein ExbD
MASVSSEKGEALELNIMPMLDIFSILVTFLLMSFSTDPVSHETDPDIELPMSQTMISLDEMPTMGVTSKDIIINDKKIATLEKVGEFWDVPEKDRAQGAIFPVFKELEKLAAANKKVKPVAGEEEKLAQGVISMEMDKDHNFKLAKRIMLSAQQAEFVTFKLVVTKPQS